MPLDRLTIYEAIYLLAAGEGREEKLFGTCAPLAREAFERSLIGGEFPIIWFEIPLSGEPWFDLHVSLSREELHGDVRFAPGAGSGYDELFRWYAEEETGGCGLAFAYDVSRGTIDDPAVHVNVNQKPLSDMDRFFELASGKEAAGLYSDFTNRLPRGWSVWYAGSHPGRPGSPVRVDCYVDQTLEKAYAADSAMLERDLRTCGFDAIGSALHDLATPILQSPFRLELQFDLMHDGSLGPTLGISAGFSVGSANRIRRLFGEGGPAATLMGAVERMGLADDRWRLIPDASFSKLVHVDGEAIALYCVPTFVKLRMREGEALDAKLYLQASAVARE